MSIGLQQVFDNIYDVKNIDDVDDIYKIDNMTIFTTLMSMMKSTI